MGDTNGNADLSINFNSIFSQLKKCEVCDVHTCVCDRFLSLSLERWWKWHHRRRRRHQCSIKKKKVCIVCILHTHMHTCAHTPLTGLICRRHQHSTQALPLDQVPVQAPVSMNMCTRTLKLWSLIIHWYVTQTCANIQFIQFVHASMNRPTVQYLPTTHTQPIGLNN